MLSDRDYSKLSFIIKFFYFSIILSLTFLIFKYALSVIMPFLLAFGICYIMEPFVRLLCRKFKIKRMVASSISVVILLIIVIFLVSLLSITVFREGKIIINSIPNLIEKLPEHLDEFAFKYSDTLDKLPGNLIINITDYIENFDYSIIISKLFGFAETLTAIVKSTSLALVFILMTIISTLFMSASFPKVKQFILAQFKPRQRAMILDAKRHLFATVTKYGRAYAILMSITFIELSIFFFIFRISPAITLAFIISIVDILPVLGVGTILLPWSLIELIMGDPWRALIILAIYVIVTIVRQVAEPKIIGDSIGLMPIVTLFCIYVGFRLFGIGGMFMLPICVIILKNMQDSGSFKIWKYHDKHSID